MFCKGSIFFCRHIEMENSSLAAPKPLHKSTSNFVIGTKLLQTGSHFSLGRKRMKYNPLCSANIIISGLIILLFLVNGASVSNAVAAIIESANGNVLPRIRVSINVIGLPIMASSTLMCSRLSTELALPLILGNMPRSTSSTTMTEVANGTSWDK